MLVFILGAFHSLGRFEQIYCLVWCPGRTSRRGQSGDRKLYSKGYGDNEFGTYLDFGRTYYDVVPVCLVIVVLVFSEIRDIVSNIGSKWSKVSLVCKYAKNASLEPSTTFCGTNCLCVQILQIRAGKELAGQNEPVLNTGAPPMENFPSSKVSPPFAQPKKTKQHIRLPVSPVPDYITGLPSNAFSVCGGKGASDTDPCMAHSHEHIRDGDQWEALARFWSEMILYVAPSQNLDGHAKAIASGGGANHTSLGLLEHAGIFGRQDWTVAAP
ncbi:hypothetical protein HU200_016328 [Digitaria exilis]|uniref:Uncharacterized protein n=1 Tax=Digitaria exilis TaxID=1010633 RepID=A0A835KJX7_9POAL|nr:hypothetical protein HU200_016328 [Digitaria exilis]